MEKCNLCPRQCGADRNCQTGVCGANNNLKVAKIMLHHWEEPILATNNSGAIFFSNCSLKCVFCQNYEISQLGKGKEISTLKLVEIFKDLESKGAENIDLVSPSHYTLQIVEALKLYKPKIPVVWNSNGYEKPETLEMLRGLVDIFLVDLKYVSSIRSKKYSKCGDYFKYASLAILKMRQLVPSDIYDGDKLIKGLIIRHLVLPHGFLDTKCVLLWIRDNLGTDTIVSIMSQYIPYYKASEYDEINRRLTQSEYDRVVDLVVSMGFENGFLQELDSADENYVPDFSEEF